LPIPDLNTSPQHVQSTPHHSACIHSSSNFFILQFNISVHTHTSQCHPSITHITLSFSFTHIHQPHHFHTHSQVTHHIISFQSSALSPSSLSLHLPKQNYLWPMLLISPKNVRPFLQKRSHCYQNWLTP